MPATAGRVKMPASNRMSVSASLKTTGIWQTAIGYDPYAGEKDEVDAVKLTSNAYENQRSLMALAKLTGTGAATDDKRGACPRCGKVGHLKFQCRNFLSLKAEDEDENSKLGLLTRSLEPSRAAGANGSSDKVAAAGRLRDKPTGVTDDDLLDSDLSDISSSDEDEDEELARKKQKKKSSSSSSKRRRKTAGSDSDDSSDSAPAKKKRKREKKSKDKSKKRKKSSSSSSKKKKRSKRD